MSKIIKTGTWIGIGIPMFIASLSTIANTWKQPKCPPVDDWIDKIGTDVRICKMKRVQDSGDGCAIMWRYLMPPSPKRNSLAPLLSPLWSIQGCRLWLHAVHQLTKISLVKSSGRSWGLSWGSRRQVKGKEDNGIVRNDWVKSAKMPWIHQWRWATGPPGHNQASLPPAAEPCPAFTLLFETWGNIVSFNTHTNPVLSTFSLAEKPNWPPLLPFPQS